MRDEPAVDAERPGTAVAVSRDGYEFEPGADKWRLNKECTVNLALMFDLLEPSLHAPYRAVLTHFAKAYSGAYCANIQGLLLALLRATGASSFEHRTIMNYRSGLSRLEEHKLGYVKAFLQRWYEQGFRGVDADTVTYLASIRLRGNEKGAAVKSLDPIRGPLDDIELQTFNESAAQAFELGQISLDTLTFALLLSHTGRRPGQLSLLRVGDLVSRTVDGDTLHFVRIPRTKQRGLSPRKAFKDFAVTAELHRVARAQAAAVTARAAERFGQLPPDVVTSLPLFPDWRRMEEVDSVDALRRRLTNAMLHRSVRSLRASLRRLNVVSHRTGERLHINPRRFRYALATRAAREGYGPFVIAELLDHSDTQNAEVYTRQHPNFRAKIDAAVGQRLVPLAQAYAGMLVDGEDQARNAGDATKRVAVADQRVGTCGRESFCGAIPTACYTCVHFQPWLHAPHQQVLSALLAERERVLEITGDELVAGAADRSIVAVRHVIAACEQRKAELDAEPHAGRDG